MQFRHRRHNQITPPPSSPIPTKNQEPTTKNSPYPTTSPLHLITRPALPEETPTPAETLLEGIIFADDTEMRHAQRTAKGMLDQLDEENLPLTRQLQIQIRLTTQYTINDRRASANALPRDEKTPTAAASNAATKALDALGRAHKEFFDLLAKHRAQHVPAEQDYGQLTPEEQAQINHEEIEALINDIRIPILGLALHQQPERLKALTKTLTELDKENQFHLNRGEPIPYILPFVPPSVIPAHTSAPNA